MPNSKLYEDALTKFRNTYGMPEYDLKALETIDMQFTFFNNTDGSTSAEKFTRLVASTARMYFESMTNLQANGAKKLKDFNASKFLRDFEDLAKARYESELEGEDKGNRDRYAGADREDIRKAIETCANEFNKPLPTLWKDQLKSGYLKIDDAKMTSYALFKKLTAKDAKKEELGDELKSFVAAREAMRQLRESRKGFVGFFWKLFNREQNNQEKELLNLLEIEVKELQGSPYNYDVDGVFNEATRETPWEENEFYRTNAEDLSADKRPEEELVIQNQEKTVIENANENQLSDDAPVNSTETEPVRTSLNLSSQDLERPVSNVPNEPNASNAPDVAENDVHAPFQEINAEPNIEEKVQAEPEIIKEIVNEEEPVKEEPVNEEALLVKEEALTEAKEEENKSELVGGENITPAEFASIYDKADKSVRNSQLTESVKGQMREILADSGADNTKIDETVDKVFQTGLFDSDDGIAAYYNHLKADMSASEKSRSSSSIMEMMIRGAGNNIRLALNGSFSNAAEQMIVHQKLLDVLLKNYSPAAFTNGIDEKYLNNYFLDDSKNLESYYRTYINKNASEADAEGFAKGVSELRVNREEANRIKAEEEAKRKAEEEEARRKEEEERLRKEEEERLRKEEEERLRKEEEERLRKEEEEARRKAEEDAKRKAEEEKQRKIEEQRLKEQYKQDEEKRLAQHETKNRLESEIETRLNERRAAEEKEVLESQKSQNSFWKRFMTEETTKEETGTIHSWKEAYDLLYDDATREETKKAILEMVREVQEKTPEAMVEEFVSVAAYVAYEAIGNKLTSSNTWDRFNEARTPEAKEMAAREYAVEAFRIAYDSLGLINYHETEDDIAKSDRWILAQNIADLMLNKYSPIASSSKYAKYGDGYFSKHPDPTVLGRRFTKQSELKNVVETVSKETNMAVPNVDYELVDLVAAKKALDEKIYESGYQNKLRIVTNGISEREAIKSQIVDILKVNADISEHRLPEKADGIFEDDLKNAREHCKAMDGELADAERDDMMRDFAKECFENTYMYVRNAHVYDDENMVHRVIAAQKITDLILSSFTPAKFDAVKYGKYADSYAFNNEEALREALENLGEECTNSDEAFAEFMNELNKARGLTSEIEETTNEESEEAIEETEEIEETEREAIPGLKDDIEGKVNTDKSARVIDEKIKNAPSLSNN